LYEHASLEKREGGHCHELLDSLLGAKVRERGAPRELHVVIVLLLVHGRSDGGRSCRAQRGNGEKGREQTHRGVRSFSTAVARLRRLALVGEATDLMAPVRTGHTAQERQNINRRTVLFCDFCCHLAAAGRETRQRPAAHFFCCGVSSVWVVGRRVEEEVGEGEAGEVGVRSLHVSHYITCLLCLRLIRADLACTNRAGNSTRTSYRENAPAFRNRASNVVAIRLGYNVLTENRAHITGQGSMQAREV